MNDLFGSPIEESRKEATRGNPLIPIYGITAGEICKNCALLWVHRLSKNYLKCGLRKFSRGPGSDHRAKWQACGKFEKKND